MMKQVKAEIELPVVPQHPPQVGDLLLVSVHKGGSIFGQVTETEAYRQIAWWEKFCTVKPAGHAWLREGKDSSLPFSPRPPTWNDAKRINGKLVRYRIVVARFHTEDNLTAKKIECRCLYLFRVTTDAEAQRVFDGSCQLVDQQEAREEKLAAEAVADSKPMIRDAEAEYWRPSFPQTFKDLKAAANVASKTGSALSSKAALEAFEIESAKRSGKLPKPVTDVSEVIRLADKLKGKAQKRDAIDDTLLDGFKNKDFTTKHWQVIAAEVSQITGKKISSQAIRKRCERLGLILSDDVKPGPSPIVDT